MSVTLLTTDLLSLFLAWSIAVIARYVFGGRYELVYYLSLSPALLLFLAVFGMRGLYPAIGMHAANEFKCVAQATTISFMFLGTFTFFFRDAGDYSRIAMMLGWLMSIPIVVSARALVRRVLRNVWWWGEPVVVIGCLAEALAIAEHLQSEGRNGLRVEGVIQIAGGETPPANSRVPVVGTLHDLAWFARDRDIQYGIFVPPPDVASRSSEAIREIGQVMKRVLVVPAEFLGFSSLGAEARDIRGQLGIEITHRLLSIPAIITKRLFDVTVGITLLVLSSPFMVIVSLAIAVSSRGRILYGQRRLGLDGKWFKAWKFRTMVTKADEVLQLHLASDRHLAEEWARDHKLRQDPRVTKIGRFLRKSSLDELPQLWNIIKGEMSLVGPRPIVESEIPKYGDSYNLYMRVRPGVTGLWQVSGRNNTTYAQRVSYDEHYVRNWSMWLDLYILYRTIRVVLLGEGAF